MQARSVIALLALAAAPQFPGRGAAAGQAPDALKLGEEARPEGEDTTIHQVVALQRKIMEDMYQNVPDFKGRRGQHPKQHGCVLATFTVLNGLPDDLKFGLFKQPASYQAVIRFSNGAAFDDTRPDVHGMAIKLVGVEGPKATGELGDGGTQDFVLVDNPVFFAKDVKNFLDFLTAGAANDPKALEALAKKHPEEFAIFRRATSKRQGNPLRNAYWSTTPYKLGPAAVKYTAAPEDPEPPAGPATGATKDYLREAMVERLSGGKGPVVFHFLMHRQSDPTTEPIEDPTVEWKTRPVEVATITIAPQGFTAPEQLEFCENLSFTPWHALEEHRPLGGINRARNPVYQMSTALRHDARKAAGREPSGRAEPTAADLAKFRRPAPAPQGR